MELLAQVGHDLPGAVRVVPDDGDEGEDWIAAGERNGAPLPGPGGWRFSLAGVGLKFSMLARGDRLTLPAFGEGGDWIVKLPDPAHPDVPRNEYAMMSLAGAVGIEVPRIRLVHRDELDGLPGGAWTSREEWAYAVARFDRDHGRSAVHIEDFAQVRNVYEKYLGNYETVAALVYRGRDVAALQQFARRLAFVILTRNGDAHLKNWSLIYRDPRLPTLSPAYDLVSTAPYRPENDDETLGLRFGGTRRFERVSLHTFRRLEERLEVPDATLSGAVEETVARVAAAWPEHGLPLERSSQVHRSVADGIRTNARTLLARRTVVGPRE